MIISTGVDLAEVDRIQAALEDPRIGKRLRARLFTEKEIAYCEKKQYGKYESYAGRFAAKEAVMKALGRGWGAKVSWLDIEVVRARSGKPDIVLHGKTAELAAEFDLSWPTMSGHFTVLREADLISADQSGTTITYHLNLSVLEEAMAALLDAFRIQPGAPR